MNYKFIFIHTAIFTTILQIMFVSVIAEQSSVIPQNENSSSANYLLFGFSVLAAGSIGYLFKKLESKNKEMTDYIQDSSDKLSQVVSSNTEAMKDLKDTVVSTILKSAK